MLTHNTREEIADIEPRRPAFVSVRTLKTFAAVFIFAVLLIPATHAGSSVKTIGTARLHSMVVDNAYEMEAGREHRFVIIDARTEEECRESHVFGAICIPEESFEKSTGLLPWNRAAFLVVYDNGAESAAGRRWAARAAAAGYTNIVIYSEGFPAWRKAGMPVAPLERGR